MPEEQKVEARIRNRFNDTIWQAAARRYGIAFDQIHLLDGFESFMLEFERPSGGASQRGILRIGHSLRRSPALIQAEADWINYLAEGGATVARALPSPAGSLVEAIDNGQGGQFLATAFTKAPGRHTTKADWTPALRETYGGLIGRMHALSRHYVAPHPDCLRYHWNDSPNDSVSHLPRQHGPR